MFGFDRAQINRARFCIWRVLLRQRFDENSDIKDMREADRLIKLGEMVSHTTDRRPIRGLL